MTDLRQAAQQALEALESGLAFAADATVLQNLRTSLEQQAEPVAELQQVGPVEDMMLRRAALRSAKIVFDGRFVTKQAEPSQWRDMVVVSLVREGVNKHRARELADHFAAQQQAEPVGQLQEDAYGRGQVLWFDKPADKSMLYTTPPQRQWVGLEAEDLAEVENDEFWQTGNHMAIAVAVEAKLKEKNDH